MNKKLLFLLTTLLCASFYSNVGAMKAKPTPKEERMTLEKSNLQEMSIPQIYPTITYEKGYTVKFGLASSSTKTNIEINMCLTILFKILEEKIKEDSLNNRQLKNFIRNTQILFCDSFKPMQQKYVTFDVVTEEYNKNNFAKTIQIDNSKIENYFYENFIKSKEINKIREELKKMVITYLNDPNIKTKINNEIEKIKEEFLGKISAETSRLDEIEKDYNKPYNSDKIYNLFNFKRTFNPYFCGNRPLSNEIVKNIFAQMIIFEKKKLEEATAYIENFNNKTKGNEENKKNPNKKNKEGDPLITEINAAIDLIQLPIEFKNFERENSNINGYELPTSTAYIIQDPNESSENLKKSSEIPNLNESSENLKKSIKNPNPNESSEIKKIGYYNETEQGPPSDDED